MATNVSSREKFSCASCGSDFDRETSVQECRMCRRSYCEECIDQQGICVPCKDD